MKKITITLSAVALAFLASCGSKTTTNAGEADSAAKATQGSSTLTIDKATSVVEWKGYKSIGYDHFGTINISEGTLSVENGNITAGEFTLDMNSVQSLDKKDAPEEKAKLEGHLKNDDFFNVEKYPTSKFVITEVKKQEDDKGNTHIISGNLTIRDVTKNISFPAVIATSENGIVSAEGAVTINRLDWGINFDKDNLSLSKAAIGKIKNGVVENAVDIKINIKTKN